MITTSEMSNTDFSCIEGMDQFSEVCAFIQLHFSQPSRNSQVPKTKRINTVLQRVEKASGFRCILAKWLLFPPVRRSCLECVWLSLPAGFIINQWEVLQFHFSESWPDTEATTLPKADFAMEQPSACGLTARLTEHRSYFKIKPPGLFLCSSFKTQFQDQTIVQTLLC